MHYINNVDLGITSNLKKQMPTIIVGSLTLIASLAWNDAIKAIIDKYVPPEYKNSQNALYKTLYAFILTCIIIIVISVILKFSST